MAETALAVLVTPRIGECFGKTLRDLCSGHEIRAVVDERQRTASEGKGVIRIEVDRFGERCQRGLHELWVGDGIVQRLRASQVRIEGGRVVRAAEFDPRDCVAEQSELETSTRRTSLLSGEYHS
jgi:hypothetical protein